MVYDGANGDGTGSRVDLGLLIIRIASARRCRAWEPKLSDGSEGTVSKAPRAGMEHMGDRPARSVLWPLASKKPAMSAPRARLATPLGGADRQRPWLRPPRYTLQQGSSPPRAVWSTRSDWPLPELASTRDQRRPGRYSLDEALGHRLSRPWMVCGGEPECRRSPPPFESSTPKAPGRHSLDEWHSTDEESIEARAAHYPIRTWRGRGGRRCRTASAK